mmetsp:Transcript_190/g.259  ORF Transcript_190/g.259 Transcript_190/m.259 type:complete len:86 (+) Transcript_190:71-328(+)
MFRRKDRPHQPSRAKLDLAINDVLDKAVNADSDKAPGQLRLLLIKEHPRECHSLIFMMCGNRTLSLLIFRLIIFKPKFQLVFILQ